MGKYLLCWWPADRAPWQDDTLYHRGLVLEGPQRLVVICWRRGRDGLLLGRMRWSLEMYRYVPTFTKVGHFDRDPLAL